MFSRPKILILVSLLFVALLNPKFNPYLLFKFLIFYHSYIYLAIVKSTVQITRLVTIAYPDHNYVQSRDATIKEFYVICHGELSMS